MTIHPAIVAAFLARNPVRDFDLDFKNGIYRRNGLVIPTLEGVGGFSHTQSGSCYEIAPDESLVAFSANQPRVVPGLGLWARSGFTNRLLRSSEFDSATWTAISTKVVTANSEISPAGDLTADTITDPNSSYCGVNQAVTIPNDSVARTFSIFVKKTVGGTAPQMGLNVGMSGGTGVSGQPRMNTDTGTGPGVAVRSVGSFWRPANTQVNNSTGNVTYAVGIYPAPRLATGGDTAAATGSAVFWGACLYDGTQPGPIIGTAGSSASNGAAQLTVPFVQKDEDFVVLAAVNMADGPPPATGYAVNLWQDSSNFLGLYMDPSGAVSAFGRYGGASLNVGTGNLPAITSRGVWGLRRKGAKFTRGGKASGGTVLGGEGASTSFPAAISELRVGAFASTSQLNGVVERVRIIPGTFNDTEFANLIAAMAA